MSCRKQSCQLRENDIVNFTILLICEIPRGIKAETKKKVRYIDCNNDSNTLLIFSREVPAQA